MLRSRVARMLAMAFDEIARHKRRTRGPRAKCYDMTRMGQTIKTSREKALQQLELLEKARIKGTIDAATAARAHAALAQEVELLHQARELMRSGPYAAKLQLMERYKANKVKPGDAASVTAALIVQLEEGPAVLSPAQRLARIKKQVTALFRKGPRGNDWEDPGINPNVFAVLHKAGILDQLQMVSCYDRSAAPVAARSAEVKELQKKLLDRNVMAGLLWFFDRLRAVPGAQPPYGEEARQGGIKQ